jgi:YjbE family integral membrane protein
MVDLASMGIAFDGLMADMGTSGFWVGVGKIIGVDIVLAGDNAIVIALACRNLPAKQRMWGILLGTVAAVLLRIFFTLAVSQMMELAYVKIVGGVALFYIALKLLTDEDQCEKDIRGSSNLWTAVRTIAIADVVMSLDNVIGIAGAANGKISLIIFGLIVSIPLVVIGAQLVMKLLTRYPILVWAGGALLGWIAGQVIATDPVVKELLGPDWAKPVEIVAVILGAIFVVGVAWVLRRNNTTPPQKRDASSSKTARDKEIYLV